MGEYYGEVDLDIRSVWVAELQVFYLLYNTGQILSLYTSQFSQL